MKPLNVLKKPFLLLLLVLSTGFSFMCHAKSKDKDEAYKENLIKSTAVLNKVVSKYKASKDVGQIFSTLKVEKLELTADSKKFLVKEDLDTAPKVYTLGRQLILDFGPRQKVTLELSSDNPNVLLIDGEALNMKKINTMKDFQKALSHKASADMGPQKSSTLDAVWALLLPQAHAEEDSFLSKYGGWIAIGAGVLLTMNHHQSIGLALVAGGGVFQFMKAKESSH